MESKRIYRFLLNRARRLHSPWLA